MEKRGSCYLAGDLAVPGYDPDLLSRARHDNEVSLTGALWSLRWAVDVWPHHLRDIDRTLARH